MVHDLALRSVTKKGNGLLATLTNDLTDEQVEIEAKQIIVERGTAPLDEVFHELRGAAINKGATDIDALVNNTPQPYNDGNTDGYVLYRVGDAVSSRSLHAALLDAFRIAVTL